ncbi:hypothetical protein QQ020_34830 [Fulvivirgaceae bacterium BMA12]|uniref:Uncharacterized protein n=2 Tax=Agaribacillus aureus TaxID=3051825 RepID=A0ABT8LJW1_9BACT|nr:hypothetical protein [Fulvivirgaceae bacterium BMA12]
MAFAQSFSEINFEKAAVRFPDDLEHIVVNTCHRDIQFTFTKAEFEEFRETCQKALIIVKANQILRVK